MITVCKYMHRHHLSSISQFHQQVLLAHILYNKYKIMDLTISNSTNMTIRLLTSIFPFQDKNGLSA